MTLSAYLKTQIINALKAIRGVASGFAPLNSSTKLDNSYLNLDDSVSTTSANPITNKAITQYVDNTIDELDASQVGEDGSYIKYVSQTDGIISATKQTFETTITDVDTNAPTSGAVVDLINQNKYISFANSLSASDYINIAFSGTTDNIVFNLKLDALLSSGYREYIIRSYGVGTSARASVYQISGNIIDTFYVNQSGTYTIICIKLTADASDASIKLDNASCLEDLDDYFTITTGTQTTASLSTLTPTIPKRTTDYIATQLANIMSVEITDNDIDWTDESI